MADESTSYSDLLSRRRFVELTGVTGAAALAGCGGDGDGEETASGNGTDEMTPDDSTPEEAEDFYPDAEHVGAETADLATMQFNPFNSAAPSVSDRLLFDKLAQYNYQELEFQPYALTDWTMEGSTLTLTLRDGLTWSNGDAVTAEDLKLQFSLAIENGDTIGEWIESMTVADDQTLEIETGDIAKPVMYADLFGGRMIKCDQATYSGWLEDIEAGDKSASDLRGFSDRDPVTNGPFTFESINDQEMTTQHVSQSDSAESPWAENINFGQYTWRQAGNNTQRLNALRSLEVDNDFSLAVPARAVASFPDAIEETRFVDVWGLGIYPNHNHQHAGDRAVRQAMAYAINRQQCVDNSLPRAKLPASYAVGISDAAENQDKWLGDRSDQFRTYGMDSTMTEKVNEVMTGAGYSKVDGTWTDEDGNTVTLPLTYPSGWGDWQAIAQTVVQNLQTVGFEASLDGAPGFYSGDTFSSGDFVIATAPWLHPGPTTHPYFSLTHQMRDPQIAGQEAKNNYPSMVEEWGGSNASITVPAMDGSGETEVDVPAKISEMAVTNDEEKMQELVWEVAWVSNVDLPTIPINDKLLQSWVTTDDWDVPEPLGEDVDSKVVWPQTWLPRQGKLNYDGN